MALKTFVKIGKIENLSDARYCAGMMVDVLGFNLEEGSEGYVDNDKFKEITSWLAGVKFCGEFQNAHSAEIKLAIANNALDYVEVQSIDQLVEFSESVVGLIYKIKVENEEELAELPTKLAVAKDLADYMIISSKNENLDINNVLKQTITDEMPVIVGYCHFPSDVKNLISQPYCGGFELEGSAEERPGFKDYDNVMDILELLDEG